MMSNSENRIELLDALRGFCIILMVAYHCGFDLVLYGLIPSWVLYNPLLNLLQPFFAGIFILISGISSRFSRNNVKRGFKTLAAAALVTVVSYLVGEPIKFGILHFLGCAMILYGLYRKWIDKIPQKAAPILFAVLFIAFWPLTGMQFDVSFLWWLGFVPENFFSADFYPILPWIFIFLLGTWCGIFIKDRKLPGWFYDMKVPVLPWIGRKSLWIYLLHQPVLTGICYGLSLIYIK